MRAQRAVSEFITQGKHLYQRLRLDGEALSDVELMALREQLHMLDTEAGRLQELKEFESDATSFLFNGRRSQATKTVSRRQHG